MSRRRRMRCWLRRFPEGVVLLGLLLCVTVSPPPPARGASSVGVRQLADRLLGPARARLAEAERLGAGARLPAAHRVVQSELAGLVRRIEAEPDSAAAGRFAPEIEAVERQAIRLADQALFVHTLRAERHEWEAVALRQQKDLADIARAAGLEEDRSRGGAAATQALIDRLGRQRLSYQMQADSLRVLLRTQRQECRLEIAERDSLVTGLRRQISQLEQRLWGVELQVGRAEADRSHAEARRKRVQELSEEFNKLGCEVLLTPGGDVVMRLAGLAYPPGGAELTPQMAPVLDQLVNAVALFPGRRIRIEGHTDDTGSRSANLRLSRERAAAVATLLRQRLKLSEKSVEVVGHGPDRPVATNATPEGRQKNRRIDVHVLAEGAGRP